MKFSAKTKVATLSIVLNSFLFILKLGMGLLSGSIALIADAIHSSTDIVSSIALLIGVKISNRKSQNFPFGLYKVENLIAVGISFIIFLTGYEIFREIFFERRYFHLTHPYIAMASAGIAACSSYLFSTYEIKMGKIENSPALKADGRHIRMDAVVSAVVFLGLVGSLFDFPAEKAATVIVIAFILKAGWDILLESVRVLLDASIDAQTLTRIREIISAHPAITDIREIIGRNSGSFTFIEGTLIVNAKDFAHAHRIIEEITEKVRSQVPQADRIVLHYEPTVKETFAIAAMLTDDSHWRVSEHFGEAPYIGWIEIHRGNNRILRMETTPNPFTHLERGKGIRVAEHLTSKGVDVVLTREPFHGKGPEYVLSSQNVKVIKIDAEAIDTNLIAQIYRRETGRELTMDNTLTIPTPPSTSG